MCDQQHHTSVHAAIAEMQVPRVRRINADVSNLFTRSIASVFKNPDGV
jgi:hypothetical protein